jgi:NitT/TauT family transport system permease protein
VTAADIALVLRLGTYTLLRVLVLVALAALVWIPVGVAIGVRPRLARRIQPVAQFLSAFPANLLFPLLVYLIARWQLNPDVWLSPLMVLGTQWYILFNVIAGALAIPNELLYAGRNLQLGGWLWFRRLALPAVFPYCVTGLLTASGGSWNAAIVAEYADWGSRHLEAAGLGSYIAAATAAGDFQRVTLGIIAMSLFVVAINRLLWRPLYRFAERRCRMD